MQCPRCQQENPPPAKYCAECAAPLAQHYAKCGTPLPPTAKFCPECAHPVTGQPMAPSRSTSPQGYTPPHSTEKTLTLRSALEGEREQVTVLFADVVGIAPYQSASIRRASIRSRGERDDRHLHHRGRRRVRDGRRATAPHPADAAIPHGPLRPRGEPGRLRHPPRERHRLRVPRDRPRRPPGGGRRAVVRARASRRRPPASSRTSSSRRPTSSWSQAWPSGRRTSGAACPRPRSRPASTPTSAT